MYNSYNLIKLFFDKIISLFLLIFLSPLIIIILLIVIFLDNEFPIFFQERAGINGKKILIYKIKTMKIINSVNTVSALGVILRKYKLDELPQLLNILKGDLSFVGPRPLYIEFNDYYSRNHIKRLSVKPGLTGLAQIKVMKSSDWNKKFNFDCFYIKNYSLKLDLYILYKTFIFIFSLIFNKNAKKHIEITDYKENFFKNYVKK